MYAFHALYALDLPQVDCKMSTKGARDARQASESERVTTYLTTP